MAAGIAVAALLLAGGETRAASDSAPAASPGGESRLPIPRFVSLKSDRVNVRKGPSTDQAIVWVFSRAGLPVEIIAESDNWRRVRDSEGADGWVWKLGDTRRVLYRLPELLAANASLPVFVTEGEKDARRKALSALKKANAKAA